jgi:hypothetical protein
MTIFRIYSDSIVRLELILRQPLKIPVRWALSPCGSLKTSFYHSHILFLAVALIFSAWPGCQGPEYTNFSSDRLLTEIERTEQADSHRLELFDRIDSLSLSADQDQKLAHTLAKIIASPLHSPVIRERAINMIARRYPRDVSPDFAAALLTTAEPDLQQLLLHHLNQLGDPRATPDLLLAMDDSTDASDVRTSPVFQVMQKIDPGPLDKKCVELLRDHEQPLRVRIAAVSILVKLSSPENAAAVINKLPPGEPMLDVLRFWAGRFQYVPTNVPRLFACRMQMASLDKATWLTLSARIDQLNRSAPYRLDPRDTHLLLKIDPALLNRTRDDLADELRSRLNRLGHTRRIPSYPNAPDDYPETFDAAADRLAVTDLLRVKLLLDALAKPQTVLALRRFLHDDLAQTESEIGGLCFLSGGQITLTPYPPDRPAGDNLYIEPAAMTVDAVLCLARWHCHADPRRNADAAGPGLDDLKFVASHDAPALVITRVNDTIINVDYFTPEGIVIDLGNYDADDKTKTNASDRFDLHPRDVSRLPRCPADRSARLHDRDDAGSDAPRPAIRPCPSSAD